MENLIQKAKRRIPKWLAISLVCAVAMIAAAVLFLYWPGRAGQMTDESPTPPSNAEISYTPSGPLVDELLGSLNAGTYAGTSRMVLFKDAAGLEKTYVAYFSWDKKFWYAELHRFTLSDGSYTMLFRHVSPHDAAASHWDRLMRFHDHDNRPFEMSMDDQGWAYALNGDYSEGGEIHRQDLGKMALQLTDWTDSYAKFTWNGSRLTPDKTPLPVSMTPSPLTYDGNTDFCRSVFNAAGDLVECGETQRSKNVTVVKWMSDRSNITLDRPFRTILFPGTHDTGSYTLSVKTLLAPLACYYSIFCDSIDNKFTQSKTVYEQLGLGVRLMDWRTIYNPTSDRYFLYHNAIGPAVTAPTKRVPFLADTTWSGGFHDNYALRQVRAFMDQVKGSNEIVLIFLQNPINLIEADKAAFKKFMMQAQVELGDYVFRKDGWTNQDLFNATLGDITATGPKVIFMLDDNGNGTAAANGFDDSYNMPHEGFWRIPARSFWASPSQDTLFNQLSVLRTNQRNFLTKGKETAPDENDPKKFDYYDFVGLGWVQTAQTLTVKAMAESTNSDLLPAKAKGLLDEKGWVERNIPQADLDKLNFYSVDYPEVANTVDFAVRQNHGRNQ